MKDTVYAVRVNDAWLYRTRTGGLLDGTSVLAYAAFFASLEEATQQAHCWGGKVYKAEMVANMMEGE